MNIRQTFFIFSLLFAPSAQLISSEAQEQKAVINEIDTFITQIHNQLSGIEKIIRSLHITIVKEKRFTPTRRQHIQAFFSQLLQLIEAVKKEHFRSADIEGCQMLVEFNNHLITLIEKHRRTKFKQVHEF